jgi:ATP adenylyltransferase
MTYTLYAPWRLDYIKAVADGPKECFLCAAAKSPEQDEENLILARSANCMLMLNRFPYVNGHMMAVPYRHAVSLVDCTAEERAEVMELLVLGQEALRLAMNPQGYNMGLNIGKCSGAGVPGHVHAHIVPRWNGDINFISIIGNVRIIPQAIEEAYRQLKEAVAKLKPPG